jgi:prepilin-type N-terminal cleavage/methylation domain-containing protein
MISAPKQGPVSGSRRSVGTQGFTLVETMVATVLLSMIAVSLLSVLVGAYRVGAKARYHDHAHYIIKSFAEQFLTQPYADPSGNVYTMFQPTVNSVTGDAMAKGTGLAWTNSDGSAGVISSDSQQSYFTVLLADTTGNPVAAQVTRTVAYMYPATGATTLVSQQTAAGNLLEGTFAITYPYLGVTQTDTITAVRCSH